jgi:hypothetical protein
MVFAESLEIVARSGSTLDRIRERIPTYLSDFREDPSWLLMFVFARTMAGRNWHWRRSGYARTGQTSGPSLFDATANDILPALREDGLFDGLQLPSALTSEIQIFADNTACFGNHDRRADRLPADHMVRQDPMNPVVSGHYFERVEDCPAIMAVQQDRLLHTVAQDYLGERACVISTRLWWSFPAAIAIAQQPRLASREMLHFDLDDWRMLKFFFYLTPVTADAGPHLFVKGSHRRRVLKHQLSLTVGRPAEEVLAAYGPDQLVSIHGDAGRGFAEDSFGFHAGSLAQATPRLMLEIGFGVTPPNRRRFYGERVLN